jgi:predicted NAD/FAD-dependent oxidoreductase
MPTPSTVAVIGAGISGLSCASALQAQGVKTVVFDKGRGVGGRTSTRRGPAEAGRTEPDPARGWDHGAVCFLAEDPRFIAQVEAWAARGLVAPWPLFEPPPTGEAGSWVGTPGMSSLAQHLAADLEVRVGNRIERLEAHAKGWILHSSEHPPSTPFDAIVLTAPAPQAHRLLEPVAPPLAELLLAVWSQPSWALLAVSEPLENPTPLRRIGPGHLPDGIASLTCEDTKPGRLRHPDGMRWLLQSSAGWAQQHLERPAEEVVALLREKLAEAIGVPVRQANAHLWRYARVHRALGRDCVVDTASGLVLAGDFCRGDGVENAWLSGRAAAEALRTVL